MQCLPCQCLESAYRVAFTLIASQQVRTQRSLESDGCPLEVFAAILADRQLLHFAAGSDIVVDHRPDLLGIDTDTTQDIDPLASVQFDRSRSQRDATRRWRSQRDLLQQPRQAGSVASTLVGFIDNDKVKQS